MSERRPRFYQRTYLIDKRFQLKYVGSVVLMSTIISCILGYFVYGKATEASINWGEASAPIFVYPLLYAGTGLDNSANVLGPEVVRMVNEFTTKKCAEVKAEAPANNP